MRRIGKKMPVTLTWSPGWAIRVFSPSTSTVMLRGMFPTGTWSLYRGQGPRARRKEHEAYEDLIFRAQASHPLLLSLRRADGSEPEIFFAPS